jgi:hypothetical protein
MRRTILAAGVGALLVSGSVCGTAASDPTAAPGAPGVSVSASVSADYTADTKKVCGEVDKLLDGKPMQKFAEELGRLIVYKERGLTVNAEQARTDAGTRLDYLASRLRERTSAAKDPRLRAAGEQSANSMEITAVDDAFFAKIESLNDMDTTLESEMTGWLAPVGTFCG